MKFSINKTKQGLGELQTTLHWIVSVSNPAEAVGDLEEDLQIRVQTSGLPVAETESTQVELQGHKINYVGKTSKAGEISWTFLEGTDAVVTGYFMNWANSRWSGDGSDTEGVQMLTSELKADLKLELLGPDDEVTQTYALIGAMPKLDAGGELGQSADPLNPVVTWEYDDFHVDAGGTNW